MFDNFSLLLFLPGFLPNHWLHNLKASMMRRFKDGNDSEEGSAETIFELDEKKLCDNFSFLFLRPVFWPTIGYKISLSCFASSLSH